MACEGALEECYWEILQMRICSKAQRGSVTRGGDIAQQREIVLHAQEQAMIARDLEDAV